MKARFAREAERAAKIANQQRREHDVAMMNSILAERIETLDGILAECLLSAPCNVFNALRIRSHAPRVSVPEHLQVSQPEPDKSAFFASVVAPSGIGRFLPGAKKRHRIMTAAASSAYDEAMTQWMAAEQQRLEQLTKFESQQADAVEAFESNKSERNRQVAAFEKSYRSGRAETVVPYCKMVLELSTYPEGVPKSCTIAYTSESKQLVVELELPTVSIIPKISEHRYIKSTDLVAEKPRKDGDVKDQYQNVVASISLRTLYELFEADEANYIEVICLNGFVNTIDPATGKDVSPHLISVRTTKGKFREIDLSRVDKSTCLKNLGAHVSRQPEEAQPVKPIIEFRMVDPRFVNQRDLVSGLSSTQNLMDLNPYEFEQLVANLFGKMGLESKLTRSSRDGGVDCVAYDARPVLGGKVVIQAKRYRHAVGVSAVRDLFGTMMNEGANKGILVTTSGYGPDAFNFAKDKPIELIDGGGLLYLLQQIGVEARIVFPDA